MKNKINKTNKYVNVLIKIILLLSYFKKKL